MIDLHCHLLPGIDDGARDQPTALQMAAGLAGLGFEAVCCTPHASWADAHYSSEELDPRRTDLAQALVQAGIAIELHPGAEHLVHEVLERAVGDRLIAYPRGDSFLMEFALTGFPPRADDLLFRLQVKGLQPVLAHAERYPEVQQDVRSLVALRQRGCLVLINLGSLVGSWGRDAARAARAALQAGLVDAATTDLHQPGEIDQVAAGLDRLDELVGVEGRARLLGDGPARIAGLARPAGGRPS